MPTWLQFRRAGPHGMCLLAVLNVLLFVLQTHFALAASSFPIALGSVSGVVLSAHPELAGDALELPTRVEAHEPDPVLHAGPLQTWPSISNDASGAALLGRVRLQCESSAVCLPFYVLVHLSNGSTSAVYAGNAIAIGRVSLASTTPKTTSVAGAHALRHGARVHLLIDSGVLHLRIPVVCLQDGDLGSAVRVQSVDRRVTYLATVIDPTTVRGTL